MSVYPVHAVPEEGLGSFGTGENRWLWTTMWLLWIDPGSSARPSALKYWPISLPPPCVLVASLFLDVIVYFLYIKNVNHLGLLIELRTSLFAPDLLLGLLLFFFETGILTVYPWLVWSSLCRPGCLWTQRFACFCHPSAGDQRCVPLDLSRLRAFLILLSLRAHSEPCHYILGIQEASINSIRMNNTLLRFPKSNH